MSSLEGLKTQLAALFVLVVSVLQMFGFVLDEDQKAALQGIIIGVIFLVLRLMTKGPAKPLTELFKRS
jgi:hypothetical protein